MAKQHHDQGMQAAVQGRLSELRRQACAGSLMAFARAYLPANFNLAPSPMHRELVSLLQQATRQRGARLAIAAPRGHAKSTIVSLAHVLWCICYQKEQFICLVCNTLDQAADSLSQVKAELQSNPRLLEDFPEACEAPGSSPGAPRWRKNEIIARNGVKVTALGAGSQIRGRRHRPHRPTLIILDDIENESEVRSPEQRQHKAEWFNRSLLKAGTATTNVLVIGTIVHYDALLTGLLDPRKAPGWTGRKYQAVRSYASTPELWAQWESIYTCREEHEGQLGPEAAKLFFETHREQMLDGTDVLWPQLEDYCALMEMRVREGRWSFDSEKQNEPVNPEDCYFQESDFHYWDDEYDSVESLAAGLGSNGAFYGACDPSMGKAGRGGDDSAIISVLKDRQTKVLYVIDADIRRRKPDAIIEDIIKYYGIRSYRWFGLEVNQYQEFLADELRRRSAQASTRVPVANIRSSTDKLGRIQRLQPLIASGMLRFTHRQVALLEQLRQFPHAAHDDGPDALEMAVRTADRIEFPTGMARFSVR